jgi:MFS family permease
MSAEGDRLFTRTFALACAMQLTGSLAGGLFILFPLFVRSLGGSEFLIGVYAGLGATAAVAVRWPVGRLLDRLGRKRIMAAASVLHATTSIGYTMIDHLGVASAVLVSIGAAAGGMMFTSFVTYASDIIPVTRRAQGFAWFGIWGMITNGLGPLLGEWLQRRYGFSAYFLTSATCALSAAVIIQFLPERHATHAAAPVQTATSARLPGTFWFLMLTTFLFGAAECSVFTFLAPFVVKVRHSTVGQVFMIYACTAVVVRVFTSHLPDRIGRTRVLAASFAVYAAAILLIPHLDGPFAWLVIGVLGGTGHGYAFPILSALVIDQAGAARGRAVSWFTAMFDLGHMLSNPTLGALAEWQGYTVMYTAVGLFTVGAATALALGGGRLTPDPNRPE